MWGQSGPVLALMTVPLARCFAFDASAIFKQDCGKLARRANHQKSVQPLVHKYFRCLVGQISGSISPVYRDKRGDRDRHDRAVGCDGREGCD
jgi:hypothetical protein